MWLPSSQSEEPGCNAFWVRRHTARHCMKSYVRGRSFAQRNDVGQNTAQGHQFMPLLLDIAFRNATFIATARSQLLIQSLPHTILSVNCHFRKFLNPWGKFEIISWLLRKCHYSVFTGSLPLHNYIVFFTPFHYFYRQTPLADKTSFALVLQRHSTVDGKSNMEDHACYKIDKVLCSCSSYMIC